MEVVESEQQSDALEVQENQNTRGHSGPNKTKKIVKWFDQCRGRSLAVQAEKEGTVEPLIPWTVVGWPVDGCRTAVGRSSAARVSSAAPKKKSFDQGGPVWPPPSNAKYGRSGFAPPAKNREVGAAPPQPNRKILKFPKIPKKLT